MDSINPNHDPLGAEALGSKEEAGSPAPQALTDEEKETLRSIAAADAMAAQPKTAIIDPTVPDDHIQVTLQLPVEMVKALLDAAELLYVVRLGLALGGAEAEKTMPAEVREAAGKATMTMVDLGTNLADQLADVFAATAEQQRG